MKVAGFTIIKNAIKYDFPIEEAIQSILPICHKVFVAVGDCEDDTRKLIENIDANKIEILDTVWDKTLNTGGIVLADETNKIFQHIPNDYDWCFYIQGDEVFHEDGLATMQQAMQQYLRNKHVDGLLVNYLHFYGSYDYVGSSNKWYRSEIRVIRNNKTIYSYKDAQGFRKGKDEKLKVKAVNAFMHHYGWVKEPKTMMAKRKEGVKFWEGHKYTEEYHNTDLGNFDYSQIDSLEKFKGQHPKVMKQRIETINWKFTYDLSYNKYSLKDKFKNFLFKLTGIRFFEYKNYIKV